MIDLHSHILPGIDDGARTTADSLAIARAAVADGIETIAATPHVRDDYPTSAETMERGVAALRDSLVEAGIELDIRPGGEIALDRLPELEVEELRRFGLGGNPRYLLVEFPYYGWPLETADHLFRLRASGFTPVIAHPERNGDVQATPERLRPLVEGGALVQVTAASLDGRLGRRPRETGLELVELRLAHLLASDSHTATVREAGMSAAAAAIGNDDLARWLARDVPAAILDGGRIPERPEPPPRRGWFRR